MSDLVVPSAPNSSVAPVQATTDDQVIALWLHGTSRHTQLAYEADARAFLAHAGKPLREIAMADIVSFGVTIATQKPASQKRRLAAVKSLLTFAHRLPYISFNPGAAVRLPKLQNQLAERIIAESKVLAMLDREEHPRNRALLDLLYRAGLRVSEAAGLRWRDLQPRDAAGQITVHGKGGKTRHVLLPIATWRRLVDLRADTNAEEPVFLSAKGGHLTSMQVNRIVKAAAARVGLPSSVSPHWLRHAHASHALDRGAPVHLVQQTLGHASLDTTSRYTHARPGDSSGRYLAA